MIDGKEHEIVNVAEFPENEPPEQGIQSRQDVSLDVFETSVPSTDISNTKYQLVLSYEKIQEENLQENKLYLYYLDSKLECAVINPENKSAEYFYLTKEQFGQDPISQKSYDALCLLLLNKKKNKLCSRKDKAVLERVTAKCGYPLQPEVVSYKAATTEVVGQLLPFAAGRLLNGVNTLLNGIIIGSLGGNAIAASPIVSALSATTLGFARGPSAALGLMVSRKLASEYALRLKYLQKPEDSELQAHVLYLYSQNDLLHCALLDSTGSPIHFTIKSNLLDKTNFDAINSILLSDNQEEISNDNEKALNRAILASHGYALKNNPRPDIGGLVVDGWVSGLVCGVPIMALYVASGQITELLGVSEEVADEVGDYLKPLSLAVLPFLWGFTDQQFALAIKESKLTFILGIGYAAISMGVGYPLALGWFGLPKIGFPALAWGITASGWINLLGLRAYFALRKDKFSRYCLFTPYPTASLKNLKTLFQMGIPLGVQPLVDWSNLTAISYLLGIISTEALTASVPSMQLLLLYTFFIQSAALSIGILVTGDLDRAKSDIVYARIYNQNARRISHAGAGISLAFSGIVTVACTAFSKQICELFTYSENAEEDYDSMLQLAQAMLIINGIALLIEPFRIVYGGALRGLRDVWFAPILSFITLSLIGLSVGGGLSVFLDWGAEWLFITRDVGILLASIGIVHRWLSKTRTERPELPQVPKEGQKVQSAASRPQGSEVRAVRSSANLRNSFHSSPPGSSRPYFSKDAPVNEQVPLLTPLPTPTPSMPTQTL
jgi:MATE family multidrug resistance protein